MSSSCSLAVAITTGALRPYWTMQMRASPRNGGVESGRSLGLCICGISTLPWAAYTWASMWKSNKLPSVCYFACLLLPVRYYPEWHIQQSMHFKCRGEDMQYQSGWLSWGKASWENMLSWLDSSLTSSLFLPCHCFLNMTTVSLPYLHSCCSFCNVFSTYLPVNFINILYNPHKHLAQLNWVNNLYLAVTLITVTS